MIAESKEKVIRRYLLQCVDADVGVGIGGVVERKYFGEGLGGIGWKLVRHILCRGREMVSRLGGVGCG